jgi:hypothetical protein
VGTDDGKSVTIVVLTEEALGEDDARRLLALHENEDVRYRVLVPEDDGRNLVADVLDHLSLLELREAFDAVRGRDEPTRESATGRLTSSLAALRAFGATADGEKVSGNPVAGLAATVRDDPSVSEVIVVTRPHAVEDTFHRDWASKARAGLGVPVLHVYAGSSWIG